MASFRRGRRCQRRAVRDLPTLLEKPKRTMTPSEKALLDLVRRTVRAVREASPDIHLRSMLDGADIALNELISRQNPEFFVTHYVEGRDLVRRGIELITDDRSRQLIEDNVARLPEHIDRAMHFDSIGAATSSASGVLCQILRCVSLPQDPRRGACRSTVDRALGEHRH